MKRDRFAAALVVTLAAFPGCTTKEEPGAPPVAVAGGGAGGVAGSAGGAMPGGAGSGGAAGDGGQAVGGGGTAGGGAAGESGAGAGGGPPMFVGGLCGTGTNPACPTMLSETGLYADTAAGTLAPGVMEFQPSFQLWSDSATKRRWVQLPEGTQISSSSMDFWVYPVGTKLWKEFSRDGVRVETRILWKQIPGAAGWYFMAFKWNDTQTDAVAMPDGEIDASATDHDIPSQEDCGTCHNKMSDRAIGFSAVQLAHGPEIPGLTLDQIVQMGWLTDAPAAPVVVPGTEVEKAAFGYLHANCGMCHNERSSVFTTKVNDMNLWLHSEPMANCASCGDLATPQTTAPYLGLVNMATKKGNILGATVRVTPGDLANSALYQVMNIRDVVPGMEGPADAGGDGGVVAFQMPPVASEMVDPMGTAAIAAWINSLPP